MAKDTYTVEAEDTAESFRFRLLRKDSKGKFSASTWCGYCHIAHLGNKYAATEYMLPRSKALTPVNAHVIANAISQSNRGIVYKSRAAKALASLA